MALPSPDPNSTAVVTGASSGIGVAIARDLAAKGHGVTLVARREERLRELAAQLASSWGVRAEAIACDLADPAARDELVGSIEELGLNVEILVNNAGFGDFNDFARADREGLLKMARLNMEAPLDLQARYLPAMVERRRGAVINIASGAAFQPLPSNATYAATKAFLLHLGEAVHHELKGSGVTLTTVCPGPVKTEFVGIAGFAGAEDRTPDFLWETPEEIAERAVRGAEQGARVVVPGAVNRAATFLGRHAPRAIAMPLGERAFKL